MKTNQIGTVKTCAYGVVKCVGEVVRGGQVIGFVHLNMFNGVYVIESARTGKIQHHFGDCTLLREFCASERCKLDLHGVEYIILDSLPIVA